MASIFSKIVKGEIPSYKVAEDEHFYAFLDISPLAKGHTLVIPKKETDYIFDIEDAEYELFWAFAKKVAKGIEKAMPCLRVSIAVLGLDVPHAHIHLVPLNSMSDFDFKKEKLKLSKEEFIEIADKINKAIEV
ncbi:MAG: HIT family protein [Bacteroidetes bacterium]|nr:HIT family protein [Bacteroidota bacterium]